MTRSAPVIRWVGAWLLCTSGVLAASPEPEPTTQMSACAALPHPGERLSCYDRAVIALPAPDPEATRAAQHSNFGLLIGSAPPPPESREHQLESIIAKVVSSVRGEDKRLRVTLDNGQTWMINSRDPLLRPGDEVTIRRAVVGSFTMSVPSRRPVKVRRLS